MKYKYGKVAIRNMNRSAKNRASYYKMIFLKNWGDKENYDLCLDSSIDSKKTVDIICEYVKNLNK